MTKSPLIQPLLIVGPTASGKSHLALAIAQAQNGFLINADSLQVYQALPILTAQPTSADQQKVPHALYGNRPAEEPYSAALWVKDAAIIIKYALREGYTPIVVGGTGLYIEALLKGLVALPEIPIEVRQETRRKLQEMGLPAFYEALKTQDPIIAQQLKPTDPQRLCRAWEVLMATGRSLSWWHAQPRQKRGSSRI